MEEADLTRIFIDEIYTKDPRKKYETIKRIYINIDEIWSIDLEHFADFKTSNNKGCRYIFNIIDNFI